MTHTHTSLPTKNPANCLGRHWKTSFRGHHYMTLGPKEYTPIFSQGNHWMSTWILGGGWTNPFEKYARQNGSFPHLGVKINYIWNHHLEFELFHPFNVGNLITPSLFGSLSQNCNTLGYYGWNRIVETYLRKSNWIVQQAACLKLITWIFTP